MAAGTAVIDVHRSQYEIGTGTSLRELPWRGNGLLESIFEGAVSVTAGTGEGPLRLTVETHDEAPALELDDWEEVVEVSQFSDEGWAVIAELGKAPTEGLPQLRLPPNSWVRIRGHARGRDEAAAHDRLSPDEDPIEEHCCRCGRRPRQRTSATASLTRWGRFSGLECSQPAKPM